MYGEIIKTPGVVRVYLSTIVARMPVGALGLLLILRTRELTGSYAAGGLVAAAYAVALGVASPVLGRLVDRRGQRLVLVASAVVSSAALAGFAALPDGTGVAPALLLAAVAGAGTPPLSACQRAIWTDALAPRLRHTAYALDSVVFELVYISGPLVLVAGVGAWSLRAALLVAALAAVLGTFAFVATRLSRDWRPHPHRPADPLGPLRGAGVRTILTALALFAIGIAATEIAVAAFAEREGSPNAVGLLLGLWGVGSLTGGLVFGRLAPPPDPGRRLALLLLALAVLEIPMALAWSLPAMAVAITLAGLAIAPGMALAFHLLSEVAPTGTVTEAQTWVSSGFGAGMAGGSALCGWLVERTGTTAGLWLVVGVGVLAAAVVAGRRHTLVVPQPAAAVAAPAAGRAPVAA